MKRLCFYCFWISDYSRLVRRYIAKDYYALSDEELLSIPFFASIACADSANKDSSKGIFERQKKLTLNHLGPEILVKERAMEIHGSLDQMRRARNLEYEESQRLHWKSDPRQLLPTAPERPEEKYEYWISVEKRYKEDVIHILGRIKLNPPSHNTVVTCHLCVLNAHRMHQRTCPEIELPETRCSCRLTLSYELYDRYDTEAFLVHMKAYHLEYFERYKGILAKMSVQRRSIYEPDKDVWQIQRLIREVYGMGDDLM
jgi:hypothetical protein